MIQHGLGKLIEEFGEALQIAGKLIGYPELQYRREQHPDGSILIDRLEDEIADSLAAIQFVMEKMKLNSMVIDKRKTQKLDLFRKWDNEK